MQRCWLGSCCYNPITVHWLSNNLLKRWTDSPKKVAGAEPASANIENVNSQVKITDSKVIGPVAGRDVNIGTLVQQGATPELPSDDYREKPTIIEIAEVIEQVPLYLRKSVATSYSGIKIRWPMQIRSINLVHNGKIEVAFTVSDRGRFAVAEVELDEYPLLKTVHGGEPVEVTGTIDWVQENALVHLKDANLKFPP